MEINVHVQGMWFKSLDLKQVPREAAAMEFSGNFLCLPTWTQKASIQMYENYNCQMLLTIKAVREGVCHPLSYSL